MSDPIRVLLVDDEPLARRGLSLRLAGQDDFALLELEDTAGGNSRGMAVDGIACPMGAHYLPVPGDDARHVQDLLEELGLRRRVAGRWQYSELNLCHSPQERLFFHGHWQEGLLPVEGVGPATLAQYRRFAALVAEARREARYTVPITNQPLAQVQLAQDAMLFSAWLGQQGLTDPQLRWYLDYCCRDDFGAGIDTVSAWAGIHYFASRHGFHAPGEAPQPGDEEAGLLTWPEGNGWLSRQLAAPLGERLLAGRGGGREAEGRQQETERAHRGPHRRVMDWVTVPVTGDPARRRRVVPARAATVQRSDSPRPPPPR